MTAAIKWPSGVSSESFKKLIYKHRQKILTGKVLIVDPSSGSYNATTKSKSYPGYAYYEGAKLLESGKINIPNSLSAATRVVDLYECLAREFPSIDVLGIEKLRGSRVPNVLHWAVGVTVAAVKSPLTLEIPINFWKAVAKTDAGYKKADDIDAQQMGKVLMLLAGKTY